MKACTRGKKVPFGQNLMKEEDKQESVELKGFMWQAMITVHISFFFVLDPFNPSQKA